MNKIDWNDIVKNSNGEKTYFIDTPEYQGYQEAMTDWLTGRGHITAGMKEGFVRGVNGEVDIIKIVFADYESIRTVSDGYKAVIEDEYGKEYASLAEEDFLNPDSWFWEGWESFEKAWEGFDWSDSIVEWEHSTPVYKTGDNYYSEYSSLTNNAKIVVKTPTFPK